MMAEPRIFVDRELAAGVRLALDEAQARHVGTVLRLEPGASVRVFNARDGEWRAIIAEKGKRGMSVMAEALLRPPRAAPDLDLMFAPVKRHATDLIVEKATELGVRRIRPVITQRTIAETVRIDRLQAIAREAAEQTERFDVPEICAPLSLPRALDGWDEGRPLLYCDEQGEAAGLLEALRSWTAGIPAGDGGSNTSASPGEPPSPAGIPAVQALALLIGPEGGFTFEERRMLRALRFVIPASLGPRILRADTAAIAALTLIQAAWGDWR
jgi:16S rRNA (uracil1498-N3)-methyltransferase